MQTATPALPLILPVADDWPVLWKLADRLRELGYTEKNVSRSMGLRDHSVREQSLWPAHLRRCRQDPEACGRLAAFFLIEEAIARGELEAMLGADVVDLLDRLFFIDQRDDGRWFFRFYLFPLLDRLFLTDGHISNRNYLDQVYPLGSDSHSLARMAPRPRKARSLDLCTGSGVHAILAGQHVQQAFGLDISPRALDFSRFNATWNRLENVEFLESDCYENVTSERLGLQPPLAFDLITANPPFVPTPETISLCRGGGVSGEDVTERIIRGLPEMLAAGGTFSMITNIPHFHDHTFFARCENWLEDAAWGMVTLHTYTWSLAAYIASHIKPGQDHWRDFQRWLESYESVGMVSITNSQVYLFRSRYPWRIERHCAYPNTSVSHFVEPWLEMIREFDPAGSRRYRLHPGLEKVWWMEGCSRVYLEWNEEHCWWLPQGRWLDGSAALALRRFRDHPGGLAGNEIEPEVLAGLLSEHLLTTA